MYISKKRKEPKPSSPYHSHPCEPHLTPLPLAKECEFIDLTFIGKTKALSCCVCESVVWMCVCSPQPQTGLEKCMVGVLGLSPRCPFAHKSVGQETAVLRPGCLGCSPGLFRLPTPCPGLGTPPEGTPDTAPTSRLKVDALPAPPVFCVAALTHVRLSHPVPRRLSDPRKASPTPGQRLEGWGWVRVAGLQGHSYCAKKPLQT